MIVVSACAEGGHTYLHKSLELNPQEGEWHSMLGNDWRGGTDQREFHLRRAHSLRPGPHTGLDLAKNLAYKDATRPEALRLVREAIRVYPNHPHILYNAGKLLVQVSPRKGGERTPEFNLSCKILRNGCNLLELVEIQWHFF